MIRTFLSLIRRFRSDEGGAFLVIFGVMAIVLIATSGAVVDFTSVEQARTRAQVALDSAALGLQPRIYDKPVPTEEELRAQAENVLRERLAANDVSWSVCASGGGATLPCAEVESADIDTTEGTLRLGARMRVPMNFVSLVGVDSMTARLVSVATRKRLAIEVAMVLDNSGSMAQQNRMGHLKAAANCAVNVLLSGGCGAGGADASVDNVRIGIVPFTEFVNVKWDEDLDYSTLSWMDGDGNSDIANDNFDDDDDDGNEFTGPVDRFELYEQMNDVEWKGCVEARMPPYDTDDTVPDQSAPDTLFVPALAPDEPDDGGWTFPNSYLDDNGGTCSSCGSGALDWDDIDWDDVDWDNFDIGSIDWNNIEWWTIDWGNVDFANIDWNNVDWNSIDWESVDWGNVSPEDLGLGGSCNLSDRELQERLCKYDGGNVSTYYVDGPNVDCPDNALLPLTDKSDMSKIKERINSMKADGGTNIHQGVMWGFHMLSPTEPLTEGDSYNSATSKVMIVMTDGENTHAASNNMNGASWYTAYGFPWNERLGEVGDSTGDLQLIMDARTRTTCENAKKAGITIYTVGLSSPDHVKALLRDCASSASKAHFPETPNELKDVFKEIASELANLRLAQ